MIRCYPERHKCRVFGMYPVCTTGVYHNEETSHRGVDAQLVRAFGCMPTVGCPQNFCGKEKGDYVDRYTCCCYVLRAFFFSCSTLGARREFSTKRPKKECDA